MSGDAANFRVIAADDPGDLVRCSYCERGMKHIVLVPLVTYIASADGDALGVGFCAYCVLAMANALAAAEGTSP